MFSFLRKSEIIESKKLIRYKVVSYISLQNCATKDRLAQGEIALFSSGISQRQRHLETKNIRKYKTAKYSKYLILFFLSLKMCTFMENCWNSTSTVS
jgi:hypothetical protein